jgi:hypothetical protein
MSRNTGPMHERSSNLRATPPKLRFAASLLVAIGSSAMILATGAAANGTSRLVTVHETELFSSGGGVPPHGSFVATGLAGCDKGTFTDNLLATRDAGRTAIVERRYSCHGGAGMTATTTIRTSQPVDAAGHSISTATWKIVSGSGALASADGSGVGAGVASGCSPVGSFAPTCKRASGVTYAVIGPAAPPVLAPSACRRGGDIHAGQSLLTVSPAAAQGRIARVIC